MTQVENSHELLKFNKFLLQHALALGRHSGEITTSQGLEVVLKVKDKQQIYQASNMPLKLTKDLEQRSEAMLK